MTLNELLEYLKCLKTHGVPGDTLVKCWDPESNGLYPVVSMLYNESGIELSSFDEDAEY